jgi:hypothetical protein
MRRPSGPAFDDARGVSIRPGDVVPATQPLAQSIIRSSGTNGTDEDARENTGLETTMRRSARKRL